MEYLEELTSRYPVLEAVKGDVLAAYEILRDCYAGGGKVMIAGNGGSCADSEHIVGELMKGFANAARCPANLRLRLRKQTKSGGKSWHPAYREAFPQLPLPVTRDCPPRSLMM